MKMGCLVMVGRLNGMGTRLLNHHVKKDGGDDGPGPEPIPLNSKVWCLFLFPLIIIIMSFNMDVYAVINDYHHLREGEGGALIKELHDSHVGRACNNCNGSKICMYDEQRTSA